MFSVYLHFMVYENPILLGNFIHLHNAQNCAVEHQPEHWKGCREDWYQWCRAPESELAVRGAGIIHVYESEITQPMRITLGDEAEELNTEYIYIKRLVFSDESENSEEAGKNAAPPLYGESVCSENKGKN